MAHTQRLTEHVFYCPKIGFVVYCDVPLTVSYWMIPDTGNHEAPAQVR